MESISIPVATPVFYPSTKYLKKQVHAQILKAAESTQIIFPRVQFVFVRMKIIVQLLQLCFSQQKPLLQ